MGKLLSAVIPIQSCTHISEKVHRRFSKTQIKPQTIRPPNQNQQTVNPKLPTRLSALMDKKPRMKLSEVVSDCVGRWFQEALMEARNGDLTMQAVVGQMYFNGYGVAKSEKQAKVWFGKVARYRTSVWKISEKRPGYGATDSDSDETRNEDS